MSLLESSVNIIYSCGLNHRQFRTFSVDMWLESRDVPYRYVVQWSSYGRVLSRESIPGKEMDIFLHEKINFCL